MEILVNFLQNNWVSLIGACIGLIYLLLEYKAHIGMWLASILMAIFYIYIFYLNGLYASMVIYIYFFIASIYGWYRWLTRERNRDTGEDIITRMAYCYILPVVIAILLIFIFLIVVLSLYTESSTYLRLGDALTTSLNIVALWMASRKWAEQWLLLIPANLISSALLFVQQDVMSGFLFLVYFVVSILGYFNWVKKTH